MKNNIIVFALLSIAYMACTKEQMPSGLNLYDTINTKDTSYVISVTPSPQTKHILMEEATGVRCPNCPAGSTAVKDLQTANPGRIYPVSVYSPFLNEFYAPALYNFNTTDAEDLVNNLGGDPSKPSATIDRLTTGNTVVPYFFAKQDWAATVANRLTKTTPVNLELEVLPNGADYYLKSKVTFTDTLTAGLALSVYVLEDSVVDLQEFPSSVIDTHYVHKHILRDIITPISGSDFLNDIPTKEKGRVFERTFEITLPSNVLNKNHVKLLCFVHKTGASKEVLQVEEIDL
ncbi:MAG: hypothetical protein RIQ62_24 [Bacteroidota bacterium]|jgi:hypothetical protein